MIYTWRLPGMKLAVGKPEYKTIIESKLVSILLLFWLYFLNNFEGHCCCDVFQGIPCLHNEIVMEVTWGIQHLMHTLVPQEKAEVAKDDRFPVSQGLKMFLSRYGFDVEPEMVSSMIGVAMLSAL